MKNMNILIGSDEMNPVEFVQILKELREGKEVKCTRCKEGIMHPVGEFKETNTFLCDKCKNQIILKFSVK